MLGLSMLANNVTLNLSLDIPTALTATLNVPDAATQLLHGAAWEVATVATVSSVANATEPHAPRYTEETALRVTVLTCMAVASLLGNLATMWNIKHQEGYACLGGIGGGGLIAGGGAAMTAAGSQRGPLQRHRRRRRPARHHSWSAVYFLIFHLAVADLLVTAFCIGGEAVWSYSVHWPWGQFACKGLKFMQMFSLYLSTFVMMLVGVDRWVAVKYPWKSLHMQRRCYRLVAAAYGAAGLLSVPQLFIFDVRRGPFAEEFHQCVTYGFYTAYWQEQVYMTFTLLCMFVVPLTVLVGTYVATFRTIAASERMFLQTETSTSTSISPKSPETPRTPTTPTTPMLATANGGGRCDFANGMDQSQSQRRQQLIHRAKIKSLRISVVIVSAFIVCWSPYYVMMLTFMFLEADTENGTVLQSAIFCFGMSNSVVNPIVYGLFHLWPMRRRRRLAEERLLANGTGGGGTITTGVGTGTRSSFTKDGSLQRTTTLIIPTQPRGSAHEERLLLNNGRNSSDGSIKPPPTIPSSNNSNHQHRSRMLTV